MLRRIGRILITIRDFLATVLVLLVASPLWWLPWSFAIRIGQLYGLIAGAFWGVARRAGMVNLKRAYPHLSLSEARVTTRRVFMNLGRSIAEGIQWSRRYDVNDGWQSIVIKEDPELDALIVADPRPKIFVTAHLGSWEAALMIARSVIGGRGAVIARSVDNPYLDAIVRKIRFREPSEWIEKRGAVPEALERLRRGESVAMLLDENGGPRGPHVEFFGRRASTRKTPALLSQMTGAPIVLGVAVRRPHGRLLFRLALIDPRQLDAQAQSVVAVTARITQTFEHWIRQDVEQWRWIHWRWRTRPDGSSETYTARDLRECFEWSDAGAPVGEQA